MLALHGSLEATADTDKPPYIFPGGWARPAVKSEAAIDIPAVTEADDEDEENVVLDLVDDSVVTHPDPHEVGALELYGSVRPRVLSEGLDHPGDCRTDAPG
jgi:hypothetical protein